MQTSVAVLPSSLTLNAISRYVTIAKYGSTYSKNIYNNDKTNYNDNMIKAKLSIYVQ